MSSSVGFTFGELGSVRDRQTTTVGRDTGPAGNVTQPDTSGGNAPPRVGDYVIDYSPISHCDLVDADGDAELESLLTASVVVRRNEGP